MKFVGKVALGAVIVIIVLVLLAVGCAALIASSDDVQALDDQPGVVEVHAPDGKCWSGAIGSSTKDGCGPKNFPITNEAIIVANAQKQDEGKWKLRLVLRVGGEVVDSEETTAEFGIAMVSE